MECGEGEQAAIQRRLEALKHFNAANFNIEDDRQYRGLVVWLEDQRIRHLAPGGRQFLRDVASPQWESRLHSYLDTLECPKGFRGRRTLIVIFLLNKAVQKAFLEREEQKKLAKGSQGSSNGDLKHQIESLDFRSDSFVSGVQKLASHLGLPFHSDSKVLFEACLILIAKQIQSKQQPRSVGQTNGVPVDLNSLGMAVPKACVDDEALCLALKSLRFLHLRELRELQDRVNEVIENVQRVTANPKTDTALGQVGR